MIKFKNPFAKKTEQELENSKLKNLTKGKTMNQIIDEIHNDFYSEVDKLLAAAKISNSLDTDKQHLIDKRNRLVALGFNNTKECKEADSEINRLEILKKENESKSQLIDAINYFSIKYPNYKLITEDSVKEICKKYNLVYATIDKYIGTVPDKNLKQMEEFKISEEDAAWDYVNIINSFVGKIRVPIKISHKKFCAIKKSFDELSMEGKIWAENPNVFGKSSLMIAAPVSDFNMKQHEIKDFKLTEIIIPDPIVLKPVMFMEKQYFLIVTAWGQEASDELVVNQKMN